MKVLRKVLATLSGCILLACSLTIDTDALEGGCPDGQKLCNGACVGFSPSNGCGRTNCASCALTGANAICSSATGLCAIGNCLGSNADCDGADENGCERDLSNNKNFCGNCNTRCDDPPNAEAHCAQGQCRILQCINSGGTDFENCDGSYNNGCEVDLNSDPDNCGGCDDPCPNVDDQCVGGECVPA